MRKSCVFSLTVVLALSGFAAARAGDIEVDGKLISSATSGPPIEIASSALVAGLNADLLDGLSASDLALSVDHVVVVAKSGGQFSSIQAAIDSIIGPAADNRYLVWIGPGIYVEEVAVGSDWIALEGAGRDSTIVSSDGDPGTIVGARVVRNMTVEASGDGDGVQGIRVCTSCRASISHVRVDVTTSTPTPGIEVGASGIFCGGCDSMEVFDTEVNVRSTNTNGFDWGIFGSAFESIRLRNVITTTSGGLSATALLISADGDGLEDHQPAVWVENVEAHAWGATDENVGAYIQGDPTALPPLRVSRLTASANGGTSTGLRVWYGEGTVDNTVVTAMDTGPSQTAASFYDGTFEVFQSRFDSPGAAAPKTAISVGPDTTASIVYSQIIGTFNVDATGQLTCRGNYDSSLGDVTCPP